MSSQMFWLLSYVSLGLALTLGNRANGGIHSSGPSSSSSSSSQSQKQQSASSGFKSRQESRLTRDDTSRILRPGGAGSMLVELDNLASYRYENSPVEFQDERNYRGEIGGSNDEENDGIPKGTRDNMNLDEFATALLDTLYPRNENLRVSDEPTNVRFNNVDNARSIVSNEQLESRIGRPRLTLKARTGGGDSPRKLSNSPIVVYRSDRNDRFKVFSRDRQPDDRRSSIEWPMNNENEIGSRASRGDHLTKRRDNAIEDRWTIDDNEIVNAANKRNDVEHGRNVNTKASGGWTGNGQQPQASSASNLGAGIASQFLLRSARGNRQYDVPQIECPASEDGMERFACPTPDRMGRYRCIDDHVLCDGFIDCPTAEDEDRQSCMFYKTTKAHLDVLADALLRWARGR